MISYCNVSCWLSLLSRYTNSIQSIYHLNPFDVIWCEKCAPAIFAALVVQAEVFLEALVPAKGVQHRPTSNIVQLTIPNIAWKHWKAWNDQVGFPRNTLKSAESTGNVNQDMRGHYSRTDLNISWTKLLTCWSSPHCKLLANTGALPRNFLLLPHWRKIWLLANEEMQSVHMHPDASVLWNGRNCCENGPRCKNFCCNESWAPP